MKYRISNTLDPEERLEDAAMAKAMHDALGVEIVSDGDADFGRDRMFSGPRKNLAYWCDPAFLNHAGRPVVVCDAVEARRQVERWHAAGKDAFVKATNLKLFALPVPIGTSFDDAVGDYIWSVIDRPACVMVQPLCEVKWEMRFVSVNRRIVTHSPIAVHLTPIARIERDCLWETPTDTRGPQIRSDDFDAMLALAETVARECRPKSVIIDCAMIDGVAGVVEFNPFSVGNFGLYACDPVAIATALAAESP